MTREPWLDLLTTPGATVEGGAGIDWASVPGSPAVAAHRGPLQTVYLGPALDYEGGQTRWLRASCYRVTDLGTGIGHVAAVGPRVMGCTCGMHYVGQGLTGACRHVAAAMRARALEASAYDRALWC